MSEHDQMEMPRYKCHKEVWALKIESVQRLSRRGDGTTDEVEPGVCLTFSDRGYAPTEVEWKVVSRYMPKPGDYYVVYRDGYKSISPAKEFDDGYARVSR